jgi:hypothetical protein
MKKMLFLILLILLTPNIFSQIELSLQTSPDYKNNTFYISKNISKNILFNIDSEYVSNDLYPLKAKYELTIYNPTNQIILNISKEDEYFISSVKSDLSLNIRSLNFQDRKVTLQVKVLLFDYYDNLIDSDYKYIYLISNNSEYEFSDNIKNKVPEYKGYSLTRSKMIILNKKDSDKIIIKNHVNDLISYGTSCSTLEEINFDLRYLGKNQYSLQVFGDSNVSPGSYFINCRSFYKEEEYFLKPITVNFLDINSSLVVDEKELKEEDIDSNFFKDVFEKINNLFKKQK